MTEYLASLGHKNIAYIKGDPNHKAVTKRFEGYKKGLANAGLGVSQSLILEGDNSIGSGEACGEKLLSRKNPPTAIFAANDDMAVGVMRTAERLGLRVPADLSIAGFDDIALARQVYPALTTISQPLASMTERAATVLIESTREMNDSHDQEIIPARLEIRDSTAPPRKSS
ncbi:MAG: substrate-binding domain-containing protein [Gammaproteobacteria bacterium]|nr:substrate-binding domain-containing protein [Gammaproteobacteria bacterium]